MGAWQVDAVRFDGAKFAARYGLVSSMLRVDFWYSFHDDGKGYVHLRDGIILPDNPPIFEAPL